MLPPQITDELPSIPQTREIELNENLDEDHLEEDSTDKRKCFPIYVEAYPEEYHVEPFEDMDYSENKAMNISEIMFSADSMTKRSSARIGNFESSA